MNPLAHWRELQLMKELQILRRIFYRQRNLPGIVFFLSLSHLLSSSFFTGKRDWLLRVQRLLLRLIS